MVLGLLVLANVLLGLVMSLSSADQPEDRLPAVASPTVVAPPSTAETNPPPSEMNEMAAVEPRVDDQDEQKAIVATAEALPHRECRVWGPEATPEAFTQLRQALKADGSFPEVKATKIQAPADYLVLVHKLGARDNAKRVAKELKALDIDNFLISRDDGSVVISVGVFSRQDLARRQFDRLTELGYSMQMEQLQRAQTVYNLVAHVEVGSPHYGTSISSCMNIAQGG